MAKEVHWEDEKEKAEEPGKMTKERAKATSPKAKAKEKDSKVNDTIAMFGDIVNSGAPSLEVEKEAKDWPWLRLKEISSRLPETNMVSAYPTSPCRDSWRSFTTSRIRKHR